MLMAPSTATVQIVSINLNAMNRSSCSILRVAVGTTRFHERFGPRQLPAKHSVDDSRDVAKTASAEAADRVTQFDRSSAAGLNQVPRHRSRERRLLQRPDRASQPKQL